LLGRFISADPTIPDEQLTQAWNRYAYVLNTPLSHTDPSGFTPLRVWHYFFSGQAPHDEVAPWQEAWAQQSSLQFSADELNHAESSMTFADFANRLLTGFRGANGPALVLPIGSGLGIFGNRAYFQYVPAGTTTVLACDAEGTVQCSPDNLVVPIITGPSRSREIPLGLLPLANPFEFMPNTAPIKEPFTRPTRQPTSAPQHQFASNRRTYEPDCDGGSEPSLPDRLGFPDFASLSIPLGTSPVGLGLNITFDRYGRAYAGPGVGAGKPVVGVSAGWINESDGAPLTTKIPSADETEAFLSGLGANIGAGIGVAVNWATDASTARQALIATSPGVGVSYMGKIYSGSCRK
jgi:hypothetical protein